MQRIPARTQCTYCQTRPVSIPTLHTCNGWDLYDLNDDLDDLDMDFHHDLDNDLEIRIEDLYNDQDEDIDNDLDNDIANDIGNAIYDTDDDTVFYCGSYYLDNSLLIYR